MPIVPILPYTRESKVRGYLQVVRPRSAVRILRQVSSERKASSEGEEKVEAYRLGRMIKLCDTIVQWSNGSFSQMLANPSDIKEHLCKYIPAVQLARIICSTLLTLLN